MKKGTVFFLALALFSLLGARYVSTQEKSDITVTDSEVNNGVVILDIVKADKAYELQCDQGAETCAVLKNGTYQMLELPKNFGMYECKNVEVYPESAASDAGTPDKNKKLGEYCLVDE